MNHHVDQCITNTLLNSSEMLSFIMNDKSYMMLYRFIERANNFFERSKAHLHARYDVQMDGLGFEADRTSLSIHNYGNPVLEYRFTNYSDVTSIHPGTIRLYKESRNIDLTPLRFVPKTNEEIKLIEDVYILLEGGAFYSDIYSDELFQLSLIYDTLTEEEIREIINRVYNLPVLDGTKFILNNNIGLLDSYTDFDSLFRGY